MLSDRDEAIRRYLDGELTPEERQSFDAQLAADATLREEVGALQRLLHEARSLPTLRVAGDLAARVRAQLRPAAPPPVPSRAGRRPLLFWLPAVAAAGLLVVLAVSRWQPGQVLERSPAGRQDATVSVTFTLRAPGAREVSVVGDFNDWQVGMLPLADREGDGTWTAKVLIPRGRHLYQFVIDGQAWLPDPEAPIQVDDGFGNRNTVLEV